MPLGSFSNQKRGESYSYFQNINYLPKLLHFSGHFQHTHHTADWLWCVRVPEVVLPEQTPTLSDEHDWSISDTLSRRHSIQRALGVPELVRACLPRVNKNSDECAFPGIDCLLKVSQPTCMSKDYHQLMKKKKKRSEDVTCSESWRRQHSSTEKQLWSRVWTVCVHTEQIVSLEFNDHFLQRRLCVIWINLEVLGRHGRLCVII